MKVIISGGGTGGHVFPAIAIADELKKSDENIDLLFVGARGRMEMERVPKAGYPIEGLWISGLQRRLTWKNILFPIKLLHSLTKASKIIKRFRPDVVVGVGGYASGPTLYQAARMKIPSLIQEQNSFPGITNRWLASKVDKICTAYAGMQKWFPESKTVLTGNPVRQTLKDRSVTREQACAHYGLEARKKTIFIVGGSLGARTLNESVEGSVALLKQQSEVQILWQVGKMYFDEFRQLEAQQLDQVVMVDFIDRMDLAYRLADVVIARAGALTVSELCLLGKPAMLVPSPYVAEDHQTKNAQALVDQDAAVLIPDQEARRHLMQRALELVIDDQECKRLGNNIQQFAKPQATRDIVKEILALVHKV